MKKLLTISILAIMLILVSVARVNAATNATLAEELYKKGTKYGMTSADRVKIERYLADHPVSEEEANKIVAKADEAVAVMDKAGTTDYTKLTAAQKNELKSIANEAAEVIDVKLVFKTSTVDIYKDGKLIESVSENNGKLAYTGNNNTVLVVSSIAVIALASVVARKKLANA